MGLCEDIILAVIITILIIIIFIITPKQWYLPLLAIIMGSGAIILHTGARPHTYGGSYDLPYREKAHSHDNLVCGLDSDYSAWKISQILLDIMCSKQEPAVGQRCRVILEGWISKRFAKATKTHVPLLHAPYGALEFALSSPDTLNDAMKSFKINEDSIEHVNKEVKRLLAEIAASPLKYTLTNSVNRGLETICPDGFIKEGPTDWRVGDFRVAKVPRLNQMVDMAGPAAMLRCCLRYGSMLAASYHWAAPSVVFDTLWSSGIRNEAFASPLNSGLFGKPDSRFFSLFKDTDAPFGSCGSIFEKSLSELRYEGGWEMNPPFIFDLMEKAAKLAVQLSKTNDVIYIIRQHDPSINPISAYASLAAEAKASVVLPANQYAYESATAAGNVLKAAPFPSHILYAGPRDITEATALLENIKNIWPLAPSRLETAFNIIRNGAQQSKEIQAESFWAPIAETIRLNRPPKDTIHSATWRTPLDVPKNIQLIIENEPADIESILKIAMRLGLADTKLPIGLSDLVEKETEYDLSKRVSPALMTRLFEICKFE